MTQLRMKYFGWGREGESLTAAEEAFVLERIEQQLGRLADGYVKPPRLEDLKLEPPRSAQSTCFAAVLLDRTL